MQIPFQGFVFEYVGYQLCLVQCRVRPLGLCHPCPLGPALVILGKHEFIKGNGRILGQPAAPLIPGYHACVGISHYGKGFPRFAPKVTCEPVPCVLLITISHHEGYVIPAQHLANRGSCILGYVYKAYHHLYLSGEAVSDFFRVAVRDFRAAKQQAVAQRFCKQNFPWPARQSRPYASVEGSV